MQKLLLLLILSFFSPQILSITFLVPTNQPGVYTNVTVADQFPQASSNGQGGSAYNEATLITAPTRVPRITQAFCNKDSDKKQSNIERNSTREYWSTYLGGIVNNNSLKEFFSIIDNQYSSSCDGWFRNYVRLTFHKVIVFGYDRNITGNTGYWAISQSTLSRNEAEDFAIQACEDAHRINKIKSFTCRILFSNNEIENNDYIGLAKLNEDEYRATISNYKNELQQVQLSESELSESADYIEKIKAVKSLLDMGIITYGEFEQMKQKIIDTMN